MKLARPFGLHPVARIARTIALAALLALVAEASHAQYSTPPVGDPAEAAAAAEDAAAAAAARDAAQAAAMTDAQIAERNAALEKALSGSVLAGQFTVNGGGRDVRPSAERYELSSVKHIQGDMWLITARIKYGDHDVTVPLPLPIRWAGNTPVITLDDFAVPGMGSYSARVMIYDDRYMGYWSAKDHGGYLFGVVEKPEAKPAGEGAAPTEGGAAPASPPAQ